jgi:beta-galactosidase
MVVYSTRSETAWNHFDAPYGIADVSELLQDGLNQLEMDVQGLNEISKLKFYLYKKSNQIKPWKTASAAVLAETKDWHKYDQTFSNKIEPCWYKTAFSWSLPEEKDVKVKIRLDGLSKGTFWVNGVCLGRYWQIGPQEEYKIPVSLLKEYNELIIFDEEGCSPLNVTIIAF